MDQRISSHGIQEYSGLKTRQGIQISLSISVQPETCISQSVDQPPAHPPDMVLQY